MTTLESLEKVKRFTKILLKKYSSINSVPQLRETKEHFMELSHIYLALLNKGVIEKKEYLEIDRQAEFLSDVVEAYSVYKQVEGKQLPKETMRSKLKQLVTHLRLARRMYYGNILQKPSVAHTPYFSNLLKFLEKKIINYRKESGILEPL